MLCKNCNYILTGKENFCPNCALPQKENSLSAHDESREQKSEKNEESTEKEKAVQQLFFSEEEGRKKSGERPVRIFTEPEEELFQHRDRRKNKGYGGKILLLLFFTCLFAAGAFVVADYFDLTSQVVNLIAAKPSSSQEQTEEFYRHEKGVVKPDVNYSPVTAYVMSGSGLVLRKGPDKSFAPLTGLPEMSAVQVCGGSIEDDEWVYVFCESSGHYGWLDCRYLAKGEEEKTTLFAENVSDEADEAVGDDEALTTIQQ